MIFVTVGSQLPFDRLVKAVDLWAGSNRAAEAFAQIGNSLYRPTSMNWARYLSLNAFREKLEAADLIVSHAGIGNVLAALRAEKPMIVMSRQAALNEIRSDHQLATVKWLRQVLGITVVEDGIQLAEALSCGRHEKPAAVRTEASSELLSAIADFIAQAERPKALSTLPMQLLPSRRLTAQQ